MSVYRNRPQLPHNRFVLLSDEYHSRPIQRDCAASQRPLIGSGVFGRDRFRVCVALVTVEAMFQNFFMSVVLITAYGAVREKMIL